MSREECSDKKKKLVNKLKKRNSEIEFEPRLQSVVEQSIESALPDARKIIDEMYEAMHLKYLLSEDALKTIKRKSEKSGIEEQILLTVYLRGTLDWEDQITELDQSEYAFNRVNSFISNGKSRKELDKDLLFISEKFRVYKSFNDMYKEAMVYHEQARQQRNNDDSMPIEHGLPVRVYRGKKSYDGMIHGISRSGQFIAVHDGKKGDIKIHHISKIKYLNADNNK